jgi:predicted house-cleaning noncanonical NTP pyrophosphatase (MazG superfamily)
MIKDLIPRMIEDVLREGATEIVDSKEARTAIGRKTAEIFKAFLSRRLIEV